MNFILDDFLLEIPQARHLDHEYAAAQPIIDYHCQSAARGDRGRQALE